MADTGVPIDSNFCLVMRFSYLGRSGWKSEFSQSAESLFEESRLRGRLDLLSRIPLKSLSAQTDDDFHLFVLTSSELPGWALDEIQAACRNALPETSFSIISAPPGPARKHLRLFTIKRYGTRPHVQITLDDDDALSSDFIATLRSEVADVDPAEGLPRFFTFPLGYGLVREQGNAPELYLHRYPYINLGLSMVCTADQKNILAIDHKETPKRYNCKKCQKTTPMFVRTVHGANDSRVTVGPNWTLIPDAASEHDVRNRFAWLLDL